MRTLMFALLLPAMLVPSGWSWRLCFCQGLEQLSSPIEASCCAKRADESCCKTDVQSHSGRDHDCSKCRRFRTDTRGLQPKVAAPDVPAATAITVIAWAPALPSTCFPSARTFETRSHAPPGDAAPLPLRI